MEDSEQRVVEYEPYAFWDDPKAVKTLSDGVIAGKGVYDASKPILPDSEPDFFEGHAWTEKEIAEIESMRNLTPEERWDDYEKSNLQDMTIEQKREFAIKHLPETVNTFRHIDHGIAHPYFDYGKASPEDQKVFRDAAFGKSFATTFTCPYCGMQLALKDVSVHLANRHPEKISKESPLTRFRNFVKRLLN